MRAALPVDAPVTLDELINRSARETLTAGARDLGVSIFVVDRDARMLLGEGLPDAVRTAQPEYEQVAIEAGQHYLAQAIMYEGDQMALVVIGPFPFAQAAEAHRSIATHLHRIVDAFVTEGIKRAMSARMHMATVEESNHELTQKNRRLNAMVAKLQEADRVKSNFLATVSHELRTPLTSIIGYSEMLKEELAGPLNAEQKEYVKTVMDKGDQLLQIISQILVVSRMDSGAVPIERVPVDVTEVISESLAQIAEHASQKKLSLTCDVMEGMPTALGDREKVKQVLINLLGNAIKFTGDGGAVRVSATIGSLGADGAGPVAVRVSVKDSGIGIAREHWKKIFDPFFQVDNSSTRGYGGTGLGLSLVRRFVEAHGGNVWLESEIGAGATFHFTLPTTDLSDVALPDTDADALDDG